MQPINLIIYIIIFALDAPCGVCAQHAQRVCDVEISKESKLKS